MQGHEFKAWCHATEHPLLLLVGSQVLDRYTVCYFMDVAAREAGNAALDKGHHLTDEYWDVYREAWEYAERSPSPYLTEVVLQEVTVTLRVHAWKPAFAVDNVEGMMKKLMKKDRRVEGYEVLTDEAVGAEGATSPARKALGDE